MPKIFCLILPVLSAFAAVRNAAPPPERLPHVALAGVRCGEAPIPELPVTADVRQFGATGNDQTDDTAAFRAALAATRTGAIRIPAGRYIITDFLVIDRPNLVLRGDGPDKTTLFFPKPLTDVRPDWGKTTSGKRTSNYSWSGGYLVLKGAIARPTPTRITQTARRGEQAIFVENLGPLTTGDWVELSVHDDVDRTLTAWLYSGDPGPIGKLAPVTTRQVARIVRTDPARQRLDLDRPLRFDTPPAWQPRLTRFVPAITNSGIERLACAFPPTPWQGEFSELGYNAIALRDVAHCWVRDIRLLNAEGGIFSHAVHCTIRNILLTADKPIFSGNRYGAAKGCQGHHGISLYGGDHLGTGVDFRMSYVHDLSVEGALSAGNVFTRGRGDDLCFDHHKRAPHANVFTDLDCGAGSRIWRNGGGDALGRPSGGWSTFWNLRAGKPLPPQPKGWGPASMNLVGVTAVPDKPDPAGPWIAPLAPDQPNLYDLQRKSRLTSATDTTGQPPRP